MGERTCDWWVETRSKCPRAIDFIIKDKWGAEFGFCRSHAIVAGIQYHDLVRESERTYTVEAVLRGN